MNTLETKAFAQEVWFDEHSMWILFTDGRTLSVPLSYFPRLLHASASERNDVVISGGGTGLHWDALDEDVSVEGLLQGVGDRTRV